MKKLSLTNLKFDADELHQRGHLKVIFGGYGSGTCAFEGGQWLRWIIWCGSINGILGSHPNRWKLVL